MHHHAIGLCEDLLLDIGISGHDLARQSLAKLVQTI